MTTLVLPDPELTKGRFASIPAYSDEALYVATGVRIAFTTREGGVSKGPVSYTHLVAIISGSLKTPQCFWCLVAVWARATSIRPLLP